MYMYNETLEEAATEYPRSLISNQHQTTAASKEIDCDSMLSSCLKYKNQSKEKYCEALLTITVAELPDVVTDIDGAKVVVLVVDIV